MYYKKISDVPKIPTEIKIECLKIVEEKIEKNIPCDNWFSRYEYKDKKSISFIEKGKEKENFKIDKSGGVGFYNLDYDMQSTLIKFYRNINHPISENRYYYLQIVMGGTAVSPHIDAPSARTEGYLYLIKSGGSDVRTVWYDVKDEYKDQKLSDYTGIPYFKLNVVESHRLEEDSWHWLNFSKIHSVENQESFRLFIYGRK